MAAVSRSEHRRKERVLTHFEPARVARTTPAIVCTYGRLFLTCEDDGCIPMEGEHGLGLYLDDCRFLDGYEMRIDGVKPTFLSSFSARGFETLHYLACPDVPRRGTRPALTKNSLGIQRHRVIRDGVLYEVVSVRSYDRRRVRCELELTFRGRFDDIFVIRGFVGDRGRERRPARHGRDTVVLRYDGLDGRERTTTIAFSPPPRRLQTARAVYALSLAPGATSEIAITVTPREDAPERPAREERATDRFSPDEIGAVLSQDARDWLGAFASVSSPNRLFDEVMRRALLDLRLLRTERFGLRFVAAGIPWFATLFGRDACVVGLQTLPFGPYLAAETLRILARLQARSADDYRDAEPGKILHELRTGELAGAARIPQSPAYFGTVDATLLWTILLGQYVNWTGDLELARSLRFNLDAAVEWSVRYADHDGDGYLDYAGQYGPGLVNQGWKDSGNAVVNADGSIARPPIALCEVQGYAYRAWRTAARLYRDLGEDDRCAELDRRAASLRRRFERDFWSRRLGTYVLARQKGGAPCAVVTSNAGQVLWSGIASKQRAARVAKRLMADDMFSGWGIRTLSSSEVAYNPISYHLGSVWPHDNSLIVGGLRRYGHDAEAERVVTALFDAASNFRDFRVPELWCGYARAPAERSPVSYPVACSPQAWAAGALPYALWQMLGLRARGREGKLVVARPRLPEWLPALEIHGLEIADASLDLRFDRRADGGAAVRVLKGKGITVETAD